MSNDSHSEKLCHRAHQPWALDWDGTVLPYKDRHTVLWRRDARGDVIPRQRYEHGHCVFCGKAVSEWFTLVNQRGTDYEDLGMRFQETMSFYAYGDDPDRMTEEVDTGAWEHSPAVWRLRKISLDGGPWPGDGVDAYFCSSVCAHSWIQEVLCGGDHEGGWWCGTYWDVYRPDLSDEEYATWRKWCDEHRWDG
jgi:hypothetical protein